jgi:hypothetical protein
VTDRNRALQALHDENERLGLYKDAYKQEQGEPAADRFKLYQHIVLKLAEAGCKLSEQQKMVLCNLKAVTTPQPKQEQGEPVAWMQPDGDHLSFWQDKYNTIPLYTTPQQRKPLTDEQIEMIWTVDQTSADDCASLYYAKVIARAIEAAHGIKE